MKKPPQLREKAHQRQVDADQKPAMFDRPRKVNRLLAGFFTGVGLLLSVDLFYRKHTVFPWEEEFGFYAVYGFVACVLLVLIAKYVLRPMVMRNEDYYD